MKEIIDRNFDSVIFTTLILIVLTVFLGFVSINKQEYDGKIEICSLVRAWCTIIHQLLQGFGEL